MIIKDINKQQIPIAGNILPINKDNIIPIKIDKKIEIVVVPNLGEPHFIEANLMPGLRKGYFYRSCVLNLDMSYDDMIFSIANTGLSSN